MQKDRGPYVGKFNGVGGKLEDSDTDIFTGMVREIYEEIGVKYDTNLLLYLGCIEREEHLIHTFAGIIEENAPCQCESEPTPWVSIEDLHKYDLANPVAVSEYIERAYDAVRYLPETICV